MRRTGTATRSRSSKILKLTTTANNNIKQRQQQQHIPKKRTSGSNTENHHRIPSFLSQSAGTTTKDGRFPRLSVRIVRIETTTRYRCIQNTLGGTSERAKRTNEPPPANVDDPTST